MCVSSPDERNYQEWAKGADRTQIIPPPTDDEVRAMVKHYIDECVIVSEDAPFADLEHEERLLRLKEEAWKVAQTRIMIVGPVMRRIMQQDTFMKTCNCYLLYWSRSHQPSRSAASCKSM